MPQIPSQACFESCGDSAAEKTDRIGPNAKTSADAIPLLMAAKVSTTWWLGMHL